MFTRIIRNSTATVHYHYLDLTFIQNISIHTAKNYTNYMLQAENLTKIYKSGSRMLTVLDNVSFTIDSGSSVAIVGPSGSGKSTLLGLCAGLDHPTSGRVILSGTDLSGMSEDARAEVRNRNIGFVFQNFQLLPTLTAIENVMVPAELRGEKGVYKRAYSLLEKTGLADRIHHFPAQLSGGEQQRVALARAFINQPKILFADEPTGNLDDETSYGITDLLFSLNRDSGTTLILVTHDLELAGLTERILKLRSGEIISDTVNDSVAHHGKQQDFPV
jgi:putative ABC transport system ATP-binding protein